jgi:hypothetical protein
MIKSEKIVIDGYMFYPNDGEIEIKKSNLDYDYKGFFTIRKEAESISSIDYLEKLFLQEGIALMVYPCLRYLYIVAIDEEIREDGHFVTFYFNEV